MWYALPRSQRDGDEARAVYPTKAEAIAAFERSSKRKGIAPPLRYPSDVSGACLTDNHIDYPHWAA